MEIAWFTDTWLPTRDGVVNSLLSFKKILEKDNEIFIFAPGNENKRNENIFYFKSKPFKKYPNYRIASFSSLFSKRVIKIVKEFNIDIIHSHSPGIVGTHAVIASHATKIPLIFTYHTFIQESVYFFSYGMQDFAKKLLNLWLKWYFRRCNTIIAPSKYVANNLPFYGEIKIIPTGIDTKKFESANGKKIKEEIGKPIILHVGRVVREKNIDLIIDAAPLILKKIDVKFVIVGEGPYRKELEEKVKKKGLDENFIFTGFVQDRKLPSYYKAADIFVFPSTYETQGIVALEAMAAGLPVVAARAKAIPEFVIDGESGYLFEPNNEKEFAEKILIALEDKEIGMKAKKFVKRYDIEKMAEKLVDLYDRIRN